jgi:very-short-patch-repair endonuclease
MSQWQGWSTKSDRAKKSTYAWAALFREKPTKAERAMWDMLKRKGLGFRFRRQEVVLGFVADFWCRSLGLIVEVDGKYHEGVKERDQWRDEIMASNDLETVRVTNKEVLKTPEVAKARVLEVIARRKQIRAYRTRACASEG